MKKTTLKKYSEFLYKSIFQIYINTTLIFILTNTSPNIQFGRSGMQNPYKAHCHVKIFPTLVLIDIF